MVDGGGMQATTVTAPTSAGVRTSSVQAGPGGVKMLMLRQCSAVLLC